MIALRCPESFNLLWSYSELLVLFRVWVLVHASRIISNIQKGLKALSLQLGDTKLTGHVNTRVTLIEL